MTKKELLEIIDKSTLKYDKDKKNLYKRYFPLIKATLRFCPDNFKLEPSSSLKELDNVGSFEDFIKNSDKNIIENRFNAILTDLNTLAESYIMSDPKHIRNSATALAYGAERSKARQKTKNKIFVALIAVFVTLSAAIAVFALLDNFEIIKVGNKIAGACGIADFLVSVGSLVYEKVDDRRKEQSLQRDIENAVNSGDVTALVKDYPQAVTNNSTIYDNHTDNSVHAGGNATVDNSTHFDNSSHGDVNITMIFAETSEGKKFSQNVQQLHESVNSSGARNEMTDKVFDNIAQVLHKSNDEASEILRETLSGVECILNSAKSTEQVLKKADALADNIAELYEEKCLKVKNGENSELLKLRAKIYCEALRNGYNDICNNIRASFKNISEYRKKLVEVACPLHSEINCDSLKSLENTIVDTLNPDSAKAKNQADIMLDDFGNGLDGCNGECKVEFGKYCEAIRNEYNDICLDNRTTFSGLKEYRAALLKATEDVDLSVDEKHLHDLEERVMEVLRPTAEKAKRKADGILSNYFQSID